MPPSSRPSALFENMKRPSTVLVAYSPIWCSPKRRARLYLVSNRCNYTDQFMNAPPDNPNELRFRPGTKGDAEAVHAMIQPFVLKSLLLDRSVSELRGLIGHSIVAEENGELVGFAAVEIYSRKLAEIQCLAVADSHQSQGIGKRLVEGCVEIAASHEVLELMAISSSEEFLQECGFDYSLPGQKRALFINP